MTTKLLTAVLVLWAASAFAGLAFTRQVLDVIRSQQYDVQTTLTIPAYGCYCAALSCTGANDVMFHCGGQACPLTETRETALNMLWVEDGNECYACACNDTILGGVTITAYATCLYYP